MGSLQLSLKKLTSKYQDQFTELESCFTEGSNLITIMAHYVMLASFLEALFNEVIDWLLKAYEHPNDCMSFSSKIAPVLHWEYGHNLSDCNNWKSTFTESFKPSAKDTKKIRHKLSFIFPDLQFIELLESIFEDLIAKRNGVAHGNVYKDSLSNPRLKTRYNSKDLKEQSRRVKYIVNDLFFHTIGV